MIAELKDEEMLDLLMTSDFNEEYSPSELKYLIFKWRYFYRILNGSADREKINLEASIKFLEEKIGALNTEVFRLSKDKADQQNIINGIKNRELTWKERISGKIITKENEDIGV